MSEKPQVKGEVTVVLRDRKTGRIKKKETKKNLVVDVGLNMIAGRLLGDGVFVAPSHIAVGDSSTAPAAGQTDLQGTELARNAFSSSSRNANEVTYVADFNGTWSGTIEEAGIFNDSAGGDMLARFLTGTYSKGSDDDLQITWKLTINP